MDALGVKPHEDGLEAGVWYRPGGGKTPRKIHLIHGGMVRYEKQSTLTLVPLWTSVAEFKAWATQGT